MQALFSPAIALMNRLKYPQKFLLLGLLLLLPTIVLMRAFLIQINSSIDFNAKMLPGLNYNAPLVDFVRGIQQHEALSIAVANGDESMLSAFNKTQAELDAIVRSMDQADSQFSGTLALEKNWEALKGQWNTLKSTATGLSVNESIEQHQTLIEQTLQLIQESGNNSNLILDPDIDTYYLMDALILKLPALTDYLSQIRTYGTLTATQQRLTPEERTRLVILSGLVRSTLDTHLKNNSYMLNYNASLKPILEPDIRANADTINEFLRNLNTNIIASNSASGSDAGQLTITPQSFYDSASTAIDRVFSLYDLYTREDYRLIQNRVSGFHSSRDFAVIFSLVMLLLSVYLFIGFYLSVRNTITSLDRASKRMVSGQMSGAFVLQNRDELAQVATAFNNVATELVIARDQALEASRAKSTFLANMSHELRTPLNAIIGYSELIEEEVIDLGQDQFIPDLRKIQAAARHQLGLINDILDLSKIEAGKMDVFVETVNISAMLQDVITTIVPLIEKNGNKLEVSIPNNLGTMRTDLTKVRQVLFNLLSNASKFTKQGTITLSAARQEVSKMDWIEFSVSDTGIGISADQMQNMFRDFQQADASTTRKYGGTGLGLSISKRFCQMLGGDISVESELGKGSTFTATLPVATTRGEIPQREEPKTIQQVPSGSLVLVIDDETTVRELMVRFLTKEGFRVETAGSGEEGIRRARELQPDVITLDVMMPNMDGWAVLTALKADPELARIPVVMLTIVSDRNMGYALGASEYMTKPIDRDKLVAVLKKYQCEVPHCQILVVEDDPATREMTVRMLQKENWDVEEAENGKVALERIANKRPGLILLDLMMPEMDGFQVVAELRKNDTWRTIPVVVVTAMDLGAEERERLSGQVAGILQKGAYEQEDLFAEVRSLVTACLTRPERKEVN